MPTFVSELPPSYRPSCFRIKIHPCRVNLATESRLGSYLRTSICLSLTCHLGQRTTTKCRSGSFSSCSYATAALRAGREHGSRQGCDAYGLCRSSPCFSITPPDCTLRENLLPSDDLVCFEPISIFCLFCLSATKNAHDRGKRCP